ncbi:cytochrome C-552 [Bradyrhizobium guangdongense]|nr:cytochrome C-552 [Bradyrhizobium guangdongense]
MRLVVLASAVVSLSSTSHALDAEQQHGQAMLQTMCARCHAVGAKGDSPNRSSPPFRTLGEDKLYDPDFLQRLQDGYSSIHRFMPTFRFNREDAEAVVNYLKAIQQPRKPK